jgi:hypothetical protein
MTPTLTSTQSLRPEPTAEEKARAARIEDLHQKYDKVVWDAVWKNLKTDGVMPAHFQDKQFVVEDLHAQCWARITSQIDKFKDGDGSSISGWLWKVSQNTVMDWKRLWARRTSKAPMGPLTVTVGEDEIPVDEMPKLPDPWYSRVRGITQLRDIVFRRRRRAVCPECGMNREVGYFRVWRIVSSTKDTLKLECGHSRPRALRQK